MSRVSGARRALRSRSWEADGDGGVRWHDADDGGTGRGDTDVGWRPGCGRREAAAVARGGATPVRGGRGDGARQGGRGKAGREGRQEAREVEAQGGATAHDGEAEVGRWTGGHDDRGEKAGDKGWQQGGRSEAAPSGWGGGEVEGRM
ncbi:glycine-rich protein 2-like [Phragmites australis]|uniref:glycine-rich protein 2-like n=1 Tax=Phragmites australis TaxID=29695 RepID=UPI002D786FE1|nr:glycine-rich protein 2-like [Phragmites australis]